MKHSNHLTRAASGLRDKFMTQRRSTRLAQTSAVATAIAVGVFWAALVVSPKPTEADESRAEVSPTQLMLSAPRDLASFDDTYQRHTGVLDTLRR